MGALDLMVSIYALRTSSQFTDFFSLAQGGKVSPFERGISFFTPFLLQEEQRYTPDCSHLLPVLGKLNLLSAPIQKHCIAFVKY